MPGGPVQLHEVGVRDLPDIQVLDGLGGEREELCAEAVAAVGLAVDEAVRVQGAQEAQGGALVHAERVGDRAEAGGAAREQRQHREGPFHGLAHAASFADRHHDHRLRRRTGVRAGPRQRRRTLTRRHRGC